jgi:uncharacterized protein YbjT (DUF2867 family)
VLYLSLKGGQDAIHRYRQGGNADNRRVAHACREKRVETYLYAMKKILRAGATGYLGGYILEELVKQEFLTRTLVRNRSKLKAAGGDGLEIREGEITSPETIVNCCEGMDAVISTVGITRQRDGLTYLDVDYQANLNLLREAQRSGVKKFIYVSVLHGRQLRKLKICEAKEKFVDELKSSGIAYCIIRPTGFFSDMSEYLDMARKGRIFLFGKGRTKINPIHGADLAEVCVSAINGTVTEMETGGPQLFAQHEIAGLAFNTLHKKIKITFLPVALKDLILFILRKFTSSKTYGPVEFILTVLTMDMTAPAYGQHVLSEYFNEIAMAKGASG